MGLQAQNAFNDKALQFTLMPLGVWLAAQAAWGAYLPHLLGILILMPFILFAPIAGWASDNFSKTKVIRMTAWMQLVVLVVVLAALGVRVFPLAVICFFFLAVQSTILSPAKNGIIKELLGSRRLGFASGIMQMFTILAILAGQIVIGFWFTGRLKHFEDGWQASLFPMIVITAGAVVTLIMAYSIEVLPPQSKRPFKPALLVSHFKQLGQLFGPRPLRLAALGIAYFWAFGTIMQLIAIQISRELYPAPDPYFAQSTAWMMLAASGGIALGSIIGAMINKRHIELGLNPLGGIIMMVSSLLLIVAVPETAFFYISLCGAGVGAAFFFVPINAFLQDECDPEQRGNILAASALFNCLAMVFAVIAQLVMIKLGLATWLQFLIVGLTVVGATWYVMRLLPRAFMKLLVLSALRAIYRIETIHADRMPKEGGILLTPNHISYLDALMLTAASPRPVRFLMVSHYFKRPLIGWFARLFDTVPISTTRAKDAIKIAAEAVEEGNVVCIFPEGELSRSGLMGEFKRGFELISRKADCLVQPVYLDGLWKSIFSAERGVFLKKMPRAIPFGVRVAFGEPRGARDYKSADVKRELNALAGDVFARRRESADDLKAFLSQAKNQRTALSWVQDGKVHGCDWGEVKEVLAGTTEPASLAAGHAGAEAWLQDWQVLAAISLVEWRGLLINAHQLADPHNLGNGKAAILIDSEASETVRRVWGMLLPVITRTQAVTLGREDNEGCFATLRKGGIVLRDLVGTERLRELFRNAQSESEPLALYLFGSGAQKEEDGTRGIFACYEAEDRILSISMPPDPIIRKNDKAYPGWKNRSYGRLLTGFVADEFEGGLEVSGEMLGDAIELPQWSVDERGFLFVE